MSYVLEAVVGVEPVVRAFAADHPPAIVVPLPFGLGLVPLTRELSALLARADSLPADRPDHDRPDQDPPDQDRPDQDRPDQDPPDQDRLPAGVKEELARRSVAGPIGYLEAEYFGGMGMQWAALWSGGSMAAGPHVLAEGEPFPAAGSPISRVLAALGVERGGHFDEFDAAGLLRHRHTDDWEVDQGFR